MDSYNHLQKVNSQAPGGANSIINVPKKPIIVGKGCYWCIPPYLTYFST